MYLTRTWSTDLQVKREMPSLLDRATCSNCWEWWLTDSWSISCHSVFLFSKVAIDGKENQTKSKEQYHQTRACLGLGWVGGSNKCLELFQLVKKGPRAILNALLDTLYSLSMPKLHYLKNITFLCKSGQSSSSEEAGFPRSVAGHKLKKFWFDCCVLVIFKLQVAGHLHCSCQPQ